MPGYTANITADLAPHAVSLVASRLFTERMNDFGKDDPSMIGCLPLGPRHITMAGRRSKVIHTPTLITILFEDLAYRQIHLDGRNLPADPNPSFMGYSVGRWEGETLVVETIGFNDRTWLDMGGHPHTERLKVVERFRRFNFGRIDREVTLIDPDLYKDPIVLQVPLNFTPDTELLETVCAENPRSRLVGRTEEEKKIVVAEEVLRTYVGVYDVVGRADLGITLISVTLSDGRLLVDLNGKGRIPLVPLSRTMFSPRLLGTYEFIADANGVVTHLIAHATEGTFRFNRRADTSR
jgi:hypothetical protein